MQYNSLFSFRRLYKRNSPFFFFLVDGIGKPGGFEYRVWNRKKPGLYIIEFSPLLEYQYFNKYHQGTLLRIEFATTFPQYVL